MPAFLAIRPSDASASPVSAPRALFHPGVAGAAVAAVPAALFTREVLLNSSVAATCLQSKAIGHVHVLRSGRVAFATAGESTIEHRYGTGSVPRTSPERTRVPASQLVNCTAPFFAYTRPRSNGP